jgi:hypothetical protein
MTIDARYTASADWQPSHRKLTALSGGDLEKYAVTD